MRAGKPLGLALAPAGLIAAAGLALAGAPEAAGGSNTQPAQARPNVVVVMTDDQTQESMRVMSRVNRRLGEHGATFANSFVNFSLCCPSRATFLTGQYAHNHGVLGNSPPNGGFERLDSSNTLAVWLQNAGYYTGHIGKYLNGYGLKNASLIPPGYSEWHGSVDPHTYTYYGYALNENGTVVTGGTSEQDYSTDVYTDKAIDFIDRRAPSDTPFFLWLAYLAPHGGGPNPNVQPPGDCDGTAKPAPRHAHAFDSEPLPQPPNFNEADVSDKPKAIRNLPRLDAQEIAAITKRYRCRLESLLAEDEGIDRVLDALEASGELDDTLVVFTSDNGYFHGEHRIPDAKVKLYEESTRVPLLIRGPGVPEGSVVRELVTNADLAPTILEATGADPGRLVDGRSLLSFASHPDKWHGRELLIETADYTAIRTRRYIYAEHGNGPRELYDLQKDPYELRSRDAKPAYAGVKSRLAARLARLRDCAGDSCRRGPRLDLSLHRRRGRVGGRRCARAPIRALVKGRDKRAVDSVRFEVDGRRAGHSRGRGRRLALKKFRDHRHETEVEGTTDLEDGRRITLTARVRACR